MPLAVANVVETKRLHNQPIFLFRKVRTCRSRNTQRIFSLLLHSSISMHHLLNGSSTSSSQKIEESFATIRWLKILAVVVFVSMKRKTIK
jgi:hypothetical protein